MFLQDNELLALELPFAFLPGQVNSLLNILEETYGVVSSEWLNSTRSDVLYEPKLAIQKSLIPVLIEIQATVDEKFRPTLHTLENPPENRLILRSLPWNTACGVTIQLQITKASA
ncbi:uncharacterized protein RHIMIDRAFT_235680 [Rhizopus microsporus ATCC 52813]|uniref:Uncharacterized protein n=1 Tax=Rhizopus microsporus ATCC 52813 TaxID=1340429 RepID=A0A2G4T1P4_RHIZD|nr:uncharacterized protein RHIMIDRAFT_235680 [Rhizopus microsporus ATCC 52813]PHZ14924.1 hypothetical protein RHIMIDRAFT_235680 [Rhizopus microsporus ATCC 52813]